jgi:hypothetical protein
LLITINLPIEAVAGAEFDEECAGQAQHMEAGGNVTMNSDIAE